MHVSAGLNQDIKHFAFTFDRAPQIHAPAVDGDEHFIKVPPTVGTGARPSLFLRIGLSEFQCPATHSLVGNINVAFSQQVLDIV